MDNTLAASRGLGKSAVPMAIVILGSCVFRVIWVYTIFAMFHTLTALYLLYIFSWSLTAIGQMVYFFRTYQKQTDGWEVPQARSGLHTPLPYQNPAESSGKQPVFLSPHRAEVPNILSFPAPVPDCRQRWSFLPRQRHW